MPIGTKEIETRLVFGVAVTLRRDINDNGTVTFTIVLLGHDWITVPTLGMARRMTSPLTNLLPA